MKVTLNILTGAQAGRAIWLTPGQELTLGRTERADYPFSDDGQMSGIHCAIRWSGTVCQIVDLHSSNGTFVNGQRVNTAVLADGDQIVIGQTKIQTRIEATQRIAPAEKPAAAAAVRSPEQPAVAPRAPEARTTELRSVDNLRTWLERRVGQPGRAYLAGVFDPDERVRTTAIRTAAWTRQPWLLDFCRQAALTPIAAPFAALELLGVLGVAADLRSVIQVGRSTDLGPRRFVVLGALGHPAVIPELLSAISDRDPATSVSAAWSLREVTGFELFTGPTVELSAAEIGRPDPDDPAAMLAIGMPDGRAAAGWWNENRNRFASASRLSRGQAVTSPAGPELMAALDLPALERLCLREHYEGTRPWSPFRLRRFPLERRERDR